MDKEIRVYTADKEKVEIDKELVLRFLRVRKEPSDESMSMLCSCIDEFNDVVSYKASYRYCDVKIDGDIVIFDDSIKLKSEKLKKNLLGCKGAFVFVATTSIGVDRLIQKHSTLRVSRAVVIDAIGSAAIESFCDLLCEKLSSDCKLNLRPRFSPGYGDLDIKTQDEVLSICDATRKIGVTLNSRYMMIPTKSVSAIVGVSEDENKCLNKSSCITCESQNCPYRE